MNNCAMPNLRPFTVALLLLITSPLYAYDAPLPSWLAGAWERMDGEGWGDEYWTPPRGGIMIGAGRTGNGDQLRSWESMRIAHDADGKLAFWAMPNGAPATKFSVMSHGDNEIIFANTEHDYPQRIRYWREGRSLMAEISLIDGSEAYTFTFKQMGQGD